MSWSNFGELTFTNEEFDLNELHDLLKQGKEYDISVIVAHELKDAVLEEGIYDIIEESREFERNFYKNIDELLRCETKEEFVINWNKLFVKHGIISRYVPTKWATNIYNFIKN